MQAWAFSLLLQVILKSASTGCNMMKESKNIHNRVLQPEKMNSIGNLAACVAHEINNPTGFVSCNLFTLATYIDDLKTILYSYGRLKKELEQETTRQTLPPSLIQRCQAISMLEEDIDLEFVLKDSQQLISESKEGTSRIQKIVLDLMDLAHPGCGELKLNDNTVL